MKREKTMFYYAVRKNMVDVIFWAAMLFLGIRYGVLDWFPENGFLAVFFMCFYGMFLIFRLGKMKWIQAKLIKKCQDAGVDLSDILPPKVL